MRKNWSIVINLLLFLLIGQQVLSTSSSQSKLLAQYIPNSPNTCNDCTYGWSCTYWLSMKGKSDVKNNCVNTTQYKDWCCACFPITNNSSYTPPDQCQPLWDALSETPVPTNTPTLTPTPTNTRPIPPVLLNPPNGASSVGVFPNFALYSTDYEQNALQYKISLCKNNPSNCQIVLNTNYGGWSKSSYSSNEQAICTMQSALELNTLYYWRAFAIDPNGSNTWSDQSTTYSFQTIPPTPTSTPTPTPTPVSDIGTGGFSSGGGGASYYISSSLISTPTPTPIRYQPTPTPPSLIDEIMQTFKPTSTPIPTPTRTPTAIPTQSVANQNSQTTSQNTSPTPTPNIPSSLTSSSTTTSTKQVNEINKNTVSKITVKPVASDTSGSNEKTLLPDEQTLINETVQNGSDVTVTLEGKNGEQFSTQGDEFIIKRTNQLVSIKTQETNTSTQKTSSTKTATPQLEINSNNVVAHSALTLSIDPLSGILTVDTPNGPQKVSIMPDEALGIVTELNAIDKNQTTHDILLAADKGTVTYRIEGSKTEKFIGIFPMPLEKIISLSADTGGIIKIGSNAFGTILGLFTF